MADQNKSALEEAVTGRRLVRIERRYPGEPRLSGYVIAVSDRLAMMQQFHDFYQEGWTVVRIDDIVDVCRDEREVFMGKIFASEGLIPKTPPFEVSLWNFQAAVKTIQANGRPVILECETDDGRDDDFILGEIVGIDDLRVMIKPLDSLGRWDEPEPIVLSRLTKLQIETPYLLTLSKYAEATTSDAKD